MPWKERSVVSLRKEFVEAALAKRKSFAELCREYKVSRKCGYKWLQRFKTGGYAALADESRRPDTSPTAVADREAERIIAAKKAHMTWGPRKLARVLAREGGETEPPSERTIARVLGRAGLVQKRRQRKPSYGVPARPPSYSVQGPNDLWTADFKGWWRTGDGQRCEPLTVRDAYSRLVLAVRILDRNDSPGVRAVFEELFKQYGLPKAIQTDNGPPFVSMRGLCGLTPLSAWWVCLGLELVRSRPGCPQDNGGHERMHADMSAELQVQVADTRQAQQVACEEWRLEFNHVRPHEALGYKTPAELYQTSPRRLGHVVSCGVYPDGLDVREVDPKGSTAYFGKRVHVTTALAGHAVAFRPVGDRVQVWFRTLCLGDYDAHAERPFVSVEPVPEKRPSPGTTAVPSSPGGPVTSLPVAPPTAPAVSPPAVTPSTEGG
jgi:putative transposase